MHINLNSIIQMFPAFENIIEDLFITNSDFRELCKDYMLCASKLLELKKKKSAYDKTQIKEYEELQEDLEHEILKIITTKGNSLN